MAIEGLVKVQVDRAERFAIGSQGCVHAVSRPPSTATIVNLSRSGCLFRAAGPIEPGTPISLSIPGVGARPAMVMRVAAEGIGCAFSAPLKPAEIEAALATRTLCASRTADVMRRLRAAPPPVEVAPPPSFLARMRQGASRLGL